jgi:cytochrome c peroxidase
MINRRVLTYVLACAAIALLFASVGTAMAQDPALTPEEQLGKALFFDRISEPDSMSCATCHAPSVGFTGPIPGINKFGAVYRGAVPQRFGNRKPPSAAYATLSPLFYYDPDEELFVGGNFWDGRATGENLGNPAADQALGPFLNPVEQWNGRIYDLGEGIEAEKKESKRPFTQANRKWSRWLKPSSLQRIPTPLKRC